MKSLKDDDYIIHILRYNIGTRILDNEIKARSTEMFFSECYLTLRVLDPIVNRHWGRLDETF